MDNSSGAKPIEIKINGITKSAKSMRICIKLLERLGRKMVSRGKITPQEFKKYKDYLYFRIENFGGQLLPGVENLPSHCINCKIHYLVERRLFYNDNLYHKWIAISDEAKEHIHQKFDDRLDRHFGEVQVASS
jgi:hypothetical protein